MATIRQFRPARAAILLVLVVAAAVPMAACYTLVQHPRVAALNYRRPQGKSCTDCHSTRAIGDYLRPEKLTPEAPPWESLTQPWWISPDSTGGDG